MKKGLFQLRNAIALPVLCFSSLAFAANGGGGGMEGGGGDPEQSSKIEVEYQVSGAASNLAAFFQKTEAFRDVKADAMAIRIRSVVSLDSLVNGTSFVLIEGPCLDTASNDHAGSAAIGQANKPFCLSSSELRKLPPKVLFEQIMGLMAHELAHQAGYDEADAVYLQNCMLRHSYNGAIRLSVDSIIQLARANLQETAFLIMHQGTLEHRCAMLGRVDALLESLIRFAGFFYYADGSREVRERIRIETEAAGIVKFLSYCDGSTVRNDEELLAAIVASDAHLNVLSGLWLQ